MTAAVKQKYQDAIGALVEELAQVREQICQHQEAMRALERRTTDIRAATENLLDLLPSQERAEWRERIAAMEGPIRIEPETGTPAYRGMLRLIVSQPEKNWRVDELETELEKQGLNPKTKTIYNALNRLAARGALVKVRRGVYRVRGYGFGIVTSENLDGTE